MSLRMEAGFEHFREAMAATLLESVEFPPGIFVTVLKAKMTANTAHAKFTLSVFPSGKEKEVLEVLERNRGEIKDQLSDRVRLRRIPNLVYEFDQTEAEAAKIEQTIHELKQKGDL